MLSWVTPFLHIIFERNIEMDEQNEEIKKVAKKILRFVTEWDALEYLKQDIKVDSKNKVVVYKKNALGLKKFGALDFLVNRHGYFAYSTA